nr:unnamed protein product [Spirometra erinaceieuropaei]
MLPFENEALPSHNVAKLRGDSVGSSPSIRSIEGYTLFKLKQPLPEYYTPSMLSLNKTAPQEIAKSINCADSSAPPSSPTAPLILRTSNPLLSNHCSPEKKSGELYTAKETVVYEKLPPRQFNLDLDSSAPPSSATAPLILRTSNPLLSNHCSPEKKSGELYTAKETVVYEKLPPRQFNLDLAKNKEKFLKRFFKHPLVSCLPNSLLHCLPSDDEVDGLLECCLSGVFEEQLP